MFYLANDVVKPWACCSKGEEIEIISARDKSAIIIKTKSGERLTVSQFDITGDKPVKVETEVSQPEIKKLPPVPAKETKPAQKGTKISQPTMF